MCQLSGEAHAAAGELEAAQEELGRAVRLWQRAGEGVQAQASRATLETVRQRLEASAAQAAGTLSLVVLHAAPLVQLASGSGGPRLEPVALTLALALTLTLTLTLSLNPNLNPNPNQVAHSKRSGLRAWQGLLQELRGLGVAARVRLDVATLDTLQHALSQVRHRARVRVRVRISP